MRHSPILASLLVLTLSACNQVSGDAGQTETTASLQAAAAIDWSSGATGTNPPIVFNATATAKPGDIVTLQGTAFGTSPTVSMQGQRGKDQILSIVNRVGDWLAVQIPTSASGAIVLRIASESGTSASIKLNAAKGYHLDALQIVPEGKFRVFGRNLKVAGATPVVTVAGKAATVDVDASDEHVLTVTAPAGLDASKAAVITVDNGNGSGQSDVERSAEVAVGSTVSPFDYSVGWTATFRPLTAHVVDIPCSGAVSQKIRDTLNGFDASGGIIQLGAGSCTLDSGVGLRDNIVIQGQGKYATILTYTSNYPFGADGQTRIGLRNLTLRNGGSVQEGPLLKNSNLVILQSVRFEFGTERQAFLDGNHNILVTSCEFIQTGSINQQSPYLFSGAKGLVFTNNYTNFVMGAAAFERVSDAYIANNVFTRDTAAQNQPGTLHMMTLDFSSRVAVMNNSFNTSSGPITNKNRNDGESLLVEGGAYNRTENLGTVASASTTTLYDPSLSLNVDPFNTGALPENYGIAIVAGRGTGQTRYVTGFDRNTVTVDRAWDAIPDSTSKYATFVWGLEKSTLSGNDFSQMPRGIWLYQSAIRDVDVTDNTFRESGGIYLRSYQKLDSRMFDPIYNVRITNNSIVNTTANWLSYLAAVFVNSDAHAFGLAMVGLEIHNNRLTANSPNISSGTDEYAGMEGYSNMMRVENYNFYESMTTPRILGTIFQSNDCTNCQTAYRIGTGDGGLVIGGATGSNSGQLLDNWKTTITQELAMNTVVL